MPVSADNKKYRGKAVKLTGGSNPPRVLCATQGSHCNSCWKSLLSSADFLEHSWSLQQGADLSTVIYAFLISSLATAAQARSLGKALFRQIKKSPCEVVLTQKDS